MRGNFSTFWVKLRYQLDNTGVYSMHGIIGIFSCIDLISGQCNLWAVIISLDVVSTKPDSMSRVGLRVIYLTANFRTEVRKGSPGHGRFSVSKYLEAKSADDFAT